MRTITWLVPLPILIHLFDFSFDQLSNSLMGLSFVILLFVDLILILLAAWNDVNEFRMGRTNEEEE